MDTIQISGQWYVVRWLDESHGKFVVVSGPYAEEHWAISMERLNEV